ncbi:MAG: sigW 4 [Verrucomicrobiales bacterium]|nr:sigW 4 [Verrucomicrobiales bacterium]
MPPETLAALYDAHAPGLYRFLLSLTASEQDTRDLLQELFIRLARRAGPVPHDPQAYLFRSARNAFVDLVKHSARRRALMESFGHEQEGHHFPDTETEISSDPTLAVAHALAALPEEQRAVVHLKIWENLTFARIAEILGIPANTAASRYRYAMDRLRLTLKNTACPHAP